jgi:hypothetical protein
VIKLIRIQFGFSMTKAEVGWQKAWGDFHLKDLLADIFWITYSIKLEEVWSLKMVYVRAAICKPSHDIVLNADIE